jgi:hypothetical protein
MSEKLEVEVTGKSKYEVAHQMAHNIIHLIDKKKYADVSRQEYLRAVSESLTVLNGGWPF